MMRRETKSSERRERERSEKEGGEDRGKERRKIEEREKGRKREDIPPMNREGSTLAPDFCLR